MSDNSIESLRAERRLLNSLALVIVVLFGASWVVAQQPGRTLDQRVADLEKRIAVFSSEETRVAQLRASQTVGVPFRVVDDKGRLLVEIGGDADGSWMRMMGSSRTEEVISIGALHEGGHVSVQSGRRSVTLFGSRNIGGVNVHGPSAKSAVFIGQEDEKGDGGIVHVFSADGAQAAALQADKNGGLLSLRGPNGAREAVSLSGGEGGGKVRVLNSAGAPLVGLLADAAGGRVVVASAASGKTVASLASVNAGGAVRVFAAHGGKTRGELVVDGVGAGLHLWDAAGAEVLVNLTSNGKEGSGRLEIGNGKGDIVVSAGATDSKKLGFVSTGPYDGGVAGTMGGGQRAASSLLGKESDR